jgi:hypothetical protein
MTRRTIGALTLAFTAACATPPAAEVVPAASPAASDEFPVLDRVGEAYARLVLAVGRHDGDYVDAFYGPADWKQQADAGAPLPLDTIRARANALRGELAATTMMAGTDELVLLRHDFLGRQLEALVARVDMLGGKKFSFDEESRALYDAESPSFTAAHYDSILVKLERALPGAGTLQQRYAAYRAQFAVPREKVDAVFRRAVDECRTRTLRHVSLPAGESFTIEYVTDKPWSGYNWYQGNYRSLIQVNTSLPIYIDRAVDLACHEGYPGHHVYNALLEKTLVQERGWKEFSVYPLFSPMSLIAEGSANYGIDVAFPGEERTRFERDVLYPLAGLDPSKADNYAEVRELVGGLSYAGNDAARMYLNGAITADSAVAWLQRYALYTPESARQRIRFIDKYRSYVINYNLGRDLVARYVESKAATPADRWRVFEQLLASPRLPSGLR